MATQRIRGFAPAYIRQLFVEHMAAGLESASPHIHRAATLPAVVGRWAFHQVFDTYSLDLLFNAML